MTSAFRAARSAARTAAVAVAVAAVVAGAAACGAAQATTSDVPGPGRSPSATALVPTAVATTPAHRSPGRTPASGRAGCPRPAPLTYDQLHALAGGPDITRPTTLGRPTPAAAVLRVLAGAVRPSGCDQRAGRYAFTHTRQWAADMASSGGVTTTRTVLFDHRQWRAPDGSGYTMTTRAPADDAPPTTGSTHLPGDLTSLGDPLSSDPALLAQQFRASHSPEAGPQWPLQSIAELYRHYAPTPAVRSAALTVLAGTPGLRYHGRVRDRVGRIGLAVSMRPDSIERDLLIINPVTGALMAYELTFMRDPGALGITEPTVQDYVLILAADRTTTPGR